MPKILASPLSLQSIHPPTFSDVAAYFCQKGLPELEAHHFFIVQQSRNWHSRKGTPIRSWRIIAYRWITEAWQVRPLLFSRKNS